jgi:hypothetical protein
MAFMDIRNRAKSVVPHRGNEDITKPPSPDDKQLRAAGLFGRSHKVYFDVASYGCIGSGRAGNTGSDKSNFFPNPRARSRSRTLR